MLPLKPTRGTPARHLTRLLGVLMLLWGLGQPPFTSGAEGDFSAVSGPCRLTFPADHAAHPGYRNEWWYYTGHLKAADGRRFGFQLTIFRVRISGLQADPPWPEPASNWRTHQVFIGHAAVSVLDRRLHLQDQTMVRGALNLAGAQQGDAGETHIFIDNFDILIGPTGHHISARTKDFAFDLDLSPQKPPVLHGDQGYSKKGSAPKSASCYYSFTRLFTHGQLQVLGTPLAVEGISWMDHEFSSAKLEEDIVGWDWFGLRLSDQTEVMLYMLRKKDGSHHPQSAGSWIDPFGQIRPIRGDEVSLEILERWKSPTSGAVYPCRWKLRVSRLGLAADITASFTYQEMRTAQSTGIHYWEGSVEVTGRVDGKELSGSGYVELTGYNQNVKMERW